MIVDTFADGALVSFDDTMGSYIDVMKWLQTLRHPTMRGGSQSGIGGGFVARKGARRAATRGVLRQVWAARPLRVRR